DLSQGPISAIAGISFDGGADTDTVKIDDGTRTFDVKTSGSISTNGTVVTLSGEGEQTSVTVQSVATSTGNLSSPQDSAIARLTPGLNPLADAFRDMTQIGFNQDLPIIGTTLDSALTGFTFPNGTATAVAAPNAPVLSPLGGLFRRLVETGTGAFSFSDIGS